MRSFARFLASAACVAAVCLYLLHFHQQRKVASGWSAVDSFYDHVTRAPDKHPPLISKWVKYIVANRAQMGATREFSPNKIEGQTKTYQYLENHGTDPATLRQLLALDKATREMATISKRTGMPDDQWRREGGAYYEYFRSYTGCPKLFTPDGNTYTLTPSEPTTELVQLRPLLSNVESSNSQLQHQIPDPAKVL